MFGNTRCCMALAMRKALLHGSVFPSLRENYEVIDEAISEYLMRLPRSLRLLAMTGWYPCNKAGNTRQTLYISILYLFRGY